MAIAGKVAITPGYEWSVDVAYDKLVVVTFENNVYLSTKPSTGIEPTNEEYWMLLIENVTAEDLAELQTTVDNIINGTTTVAKATDADTVDGYHVTTNGTKGVVCISADYGTTEIGKYLDFHTEAGQDYSGRLFVNAENELYYGIPNVGSYRVLHGNNYKSVVLPLDGSVPMSGGLTVKGRITTDMGDGAFTCLQVKRKLNDIAYRANYGLSAGPSATVELVDDSGSGLLSTLALTPTGVRYNNSEILHTGNKPEGTYTGNGSSTQRTINTGGIGNTLVFRCGGEVGLISRYGGVVFNFGAKETFYFNESEMNFKEGILTLATDSIYVNSSGGIYEYYVA